MQAGGDISHLEENRRHEARDSCLSCARIAFENHVVPASKKGVIGDVSGHKYYTPKQADFSARKFLASETIIALPGVHGYVRDHSGSPWWC